MSFAVMKFENMSSYFIKNIVSNNSHFLQKRCFQSQLNIIYDIFIKKYFLLIIINHWFIKIMSINILLRINKDNFAVVTLKKKKDFSRLRCVLKRLDVLKIYTQNSIQVQANEVHGRNQFFHKNEYVHVIIESNAKRQKAARGSIS